MLSDEQHLFLGLVERVAGIGWWRIDLVHGEIYWSQRVYEIHGVSPDDYSPDLESAIEFYHPEDQHKVNEFVSAAIEEKKSFEFELRIIRNDQSIRWVHSKGECAVDDEGNVSDVYGVFQDITERKGAQARFELSVGAARAGVWDWDIPKGVFITNTLFHSMLGEEPASGPLPLSYFLNLLHPDDVERANQEIQNAHTIKNYIYDIEFRLQCQDGSYKWIRSSGQVMEYDINDAPLRMIGQHFDIHEQKSLETKLRDALVDAKKANLAKSQFLANMSHEIRTPMNGVLGMSELLLSTKLSDEQQELAHSLKRSGESLLRVINDILDFSKIEAGKIDLAPTVFSINDLMEDTVKLYSVLASQKNLSLCLSIMPGMPSYLVGDPDRLRQVIVNLIGNAIKFTPEGGHVTVSVAPERKISGKMFVLFQISDTGIGISKEKQAKIFEAFVQADADTTREYGGTGLGLSISSKLVALMGGKIGLHSEPGYGATFHFSVPFVLANAPAEKTINISCDTGSCGPLHILLAEDNLINQKVAIKFLENNGHQVVVAGNGQIAVDKIQQDEFDIILMDIQMPVMGGDEAAAAIREIPGCEGIPIIALTANAMSGDREKYLAQGFDGYVSKPINKTQLFSEIDRLAKGTVVSRKAPSMS